MSTLAEKFGIDVHVHARPAAWHRGVVYAAALGVVAYVVATDDDGKDDGRAVAALLLAMLAVWLA
jgi:hypothetical protein